VAGTLRNLGTTPYQRHIQSASPTSTVLQFASPHAYNRGTTEIDNLSLQHPLRKADQKKGTHLLEFIFEPSHCCSTPKNTQLLSSACVGSWDRVRIVVSYLHLRKSQQSGRGGLDNTSYHACTITNTKLSSQNNNRDRLGNPSKEIHPSNVCFPLLEHR